MPAAATSEMTSEKRKQVPPPPAAAPTEERRRVLLALAAIACLGFLIYLPGLNAPFIFDDLRHIVVEDSSLVRSLWPWGEAPPLGRCFGTWTFQVNYALHGLNVRGWRLTNVAIHIAAAMVLYDLVRRTLKLPGIPVFFAAHWQWFALSVSLIWLAHPLQTQSVTYIIQRYESLMGLCYLLMLYCLLRGSQSPHPWRWYLASLVAAWAGAGTKEVMISAALVALVYDRAYLASSWSEIGRRRWGLYLGLFAVTAWLMYASLTGMFDSANDGAGFDQPISAWEYLRTQPAVLLYYIKLVFWPRILILDHGWPIETSPWRIYGLGLVIVASLAASLWALGRHPRVGVLALAYFLILAPTSSIIPIDDLAFEHRMYLPLASVVLLVALLVGALAAASISSAEHREQFLWMGTGLILGALSLRAFTRNADYTDPAKIWTQAIANNPAHARPYAALAKWHLKTGRRDDAIATCERLLALPAISPAAASTCADVFFQAGKLDRAAALYRLATAADPTGSFSAHVNLARLELRQKNYKEAVAASRQAVACRPDSQLATEQLAWLLATAPQDDLRNGSEALQLLDKLPPETGAPRLTRRMSLAAALAETGKFAEAAQAIEPWLLQANKTGGKVDPDLQRQFDSYRENRPWRLALPEEPAASVAQ